MITEDYVNKEIAELLEKKGFDWECKTMKYFPEPDYDQESPDGVYAPTLQMTMKWLREVHNLNVEVYRTACGYIGCIVDVPSGTDIDFIDEDGDDVWSGQYTKWEYACEAAIKYTLEHLI